MLPKIAFISFSLIQVALGVVIFQHLDALPRNTEYDFIIAGGGTGGGVVAGRLAENPNWKILVIEAGPSNEGIFEVKVPGLCGLVSGNPLLSWNYVTTPQTSMNGRVSDYARGKLLGGCSSHNGLGYTRGSRDDWDRWANITGDEGLKWDNMLPVMMKGENFVRDPTGLPLEGHFDPAVHGHNGKLFVSAPYTLHPFNDMLLQVTKELSDEFPAVLDCNGGTPIGICWSQYTSDQNSTRSSSATAYIETSNDNLHVVLNTYVTRVLPSSSSSSLADSVGGSTHFSGVEIAPAPAPSSTNVTNTQVTLAKHLFAKKEVIVAGGVIGTPQILLNSGIGNHQELEAVGIKTIVDNPSVGKNFTDQVAVALVFNTTIQNTDFNTDAAVAEWNRSHTGPMIEPAPLHNQIIFVRLPDDSPPFSQYGFADPSPGKNAPHIEVYTAQISATPLPVNGQLSPEVNGLNTLWLAAINLHPASRGSITLTSSNPFVPPTINPNLLSAPVDLAILRESIRSMRHLFSSAPVFKDNVFGSVYPESNITTDDDLDLFIRADALPYLHGGCSASMSPRGANWGVVDPDFSVKGTKGLRIVDASVFPTIPSGHTQAHVYGLAERASVLIKDAWST